MKDLLGTMRAKVLDMHTREQRKGTLHAWKTPLPKSYMQFLVESREMHAALQVSTAHIPHIHSFDLVSPIERDLQHISLKFDLPVPRPLERGPGSTYARVLEYGSVPTVLSHWYLIHFAHLSGGSLVGCRVAESLLDGRMPEFNRPPEGVGLGDLRTQLEDISGVWTDEEQWNFLEEAGSGFYHVNAVTQSMFRA